MCMRDFEKRMLKAAGLFDRLRDRDKEKMEQFQWKQPAEGACQYWVGPGKGTRGQTWCEAPATHIVRYPASTVDPERDMPVCQQHHDMEKADQDKVDQLYQERRVKHGPYADNPRQFFQMGEELPWRSPALRPTSYPTFLPPGE